MSFSPEELDRYARHIVLRELGGPGQARLKAASVLVVGAGGLGAPALLYLAAAGVGHISLVDDDTVSLSNLQRQVIYVSADAGRPKAEAAAERLSALNPHTVIETHALHLGPDNVHELVAGRDLVLDGTDSFATRYLVNEAAVAARVPLISGALSQWEGQISLFAPHLGAPCYACVFPRPPAPGLAPDCAEAGVLGALAGVIGAMMAAEAVKHIASAGQGLAGSLMIYDCLYAETRKMRVARREDCPVCGAGR
ncbi:MAG: HesA/MoeB/ThiF family protein [Alphaproteobacteria bacterium]|nr:MAG: HesA/MoeB/ThiF family protein [Alphaproteobacteria bacterium]